MGGVFSDISGTGAEIPGTKIPKFFEINAGGQKFWVHPNGTKYMAEYILSYPTTHGMPTRCQSLLQSFQAAVSDATSNGVVFDRVIRVGNWELIFSAPRPEGLLPVIKHAVHFP